VQALEQALELVQGRELVLAREQVQALEQALELVQGRELVLAREQVQALEQAQEQELVQGREQVQALEQAQVGASQPVPKPDRVRAAVITLRHGTYASGLGRPTSRRTMPATHRTRFARS
jgi:hypothetical protein